MPSARSGSSPLARGTPSLANANVPVNRLIPARAGNTSSSSPAQSPEPAHPRSRGEHSLPLRRLRTRSGSSPLARGTPLCPVPELGRNRLIPARAGNTRAGRCPGAGASAHPRSRGEHEGRTMSWCWCFGSSPLARGTRGQDDVLVLVLRLIPARAGNTYRQR